MIHLFDPRSAGADVPAIGGKGLNLLRLSPACRVPPWVALPADAFAEFLAQGGLFQRIAATLEGLHKDNAGAKARDVQAMIGETPLPAWLETELAGVDFVGGAGGGYVSVRSSAADEDGRRHSFAGVHESFLHVRGAAAVARHVRQVWMSGYDERALLYRHANRMVLHPVPMAVLVQQMVDAEVSGVVFTADPSTQDPQAVVVSSLYGLGEGLVSAGLAADLVRYRKPTGEIETTVADKPTRYVPDRVSGEGVVEQPVPESMRNAPALSESMRDAVIRVALAIETARRRPQDIEFCVDPTGRLYILQTRDITTVSDAGPAAGFRQVWDNSNIIESYSGVTSPMTFSFIRHAYTVVYHCFSQVMGVPPRTVREHTAVYENMLGLIRGQVYYNLLNWYRLIRQFPGYAMNRRFMESMMGVRERLDPDEDAVAPGALQRWLVEFSRTLWLALRMMLRFAVLDRSVTRFQDRFRALYERWEAMDFDACSPSELMAVYRDMERRLLWNWQAPIVNDFYVMIHYGLLRKLCRDWCGDQAESLQNDLICGNGDIESTEPTRLLMRLALRIRSCPEQLSLFESTDARVLAQRVPKDPACVDVAASVATYLKRYGFRCVNELKLEEPSLRETPEFVYRILQNYLKVDPPLLDAGAMAERERQIRCGAEQRSEAALAELRFPRLRRAVFRHILRGARKGVRNRENLRFARTRIYGVLRELLQAMGRHLCEAGLLGDAHDIFYLTIDEVWDFVKGTAVTTDLRGLATLRRREFDAYRSDAAPVADDRFETYGMVYVDNSFRVRRPVVSGEGDLAGTGCCPGEITAPVRIVRNPRDDLDLSGRILVAERTDPGWVPLYPAVRGILIERGSILSHSAIVAREMGIPAIVGIPGLLEAVADGQTVSMNGQTGCVRLVWEGSRN